MRVLREGKPWSLGVRCLNGCGGVYQVFEADVHYLIHRAPETFHFNCPVCVEWQFVPRESIPVYIRCRVMLARPVKKEPHE